MATIGDDEHETQFSQKELRFCSDFLVSSKTSNESDFKIVSDFLRFSLILTQFNFVSICQIFDWKLLEVK